MALVLPSKISADGVAGAGVGTQWAFRPIKRRAQLALCNIGHAADIWVVELLSEGHRRAMLRLSGASLHRLGAVKQGARPCSAYSSHRRFTILCSENWCAREDVGVACSRSKLLSVLR
jgi:hypothetical protein